MTNFGLWLIGIIILLVTLLILFFDLKIINLRRTWQYFFYIFLMVFFYQFSSKFTTLHGS